VKRRLGLSLASCLVAALGHVACGSKTPEADDVAQTGLLLEVCEDLVDRGFVETCGTEPDECSDSARGGCLQLEGADIVVGRHGPDDVDTDSEDPPVDVAGLLEMIPFVDKSARENIPVTGTVIIGDPAAEGEVYVEIDPEIADYDITDGQMLTAVASGEGAFGDEYYRSNVSGFFPVMGIDPTQAVFEIRGQGATSSDGSSGIMSKTVFVMREVNGIQVLSNRLIFDYRADTGELSEIKGTWNRVDYANSQFAIDAPSIDDLASGLVSRFEELDIESSSLGDVILSLSYRVDEDSQTLDLMLEIAKGLTVVDMDI
jgi:hypothetical protein